MTYETAFTPYASLAGGAMIGLAAVLLMLLLGRVLGATGILAGVFGFGDRAGWPVRVAILAGMVLGPAIYLAATGAWPTVTVPVERAMLIAGGLLVGVGVTFAGGCTSGHGVCGMARLSQRSIVATLTFMATTFVTVYLVRHVMGA